MRLKEFHEKRKLPAKTMLNRVDKNVPNLRERFFRFFIVTIITSSFICEKCWFFQTMAFKGPECSICYEGYNDEKKCPRLLSCGHSFCFSCLERLLHGNSIDCPKCRHAVAVPTGVQGLLKNFALLDIVKEAPKEQAGHTEHTGTYDCEACDENTPRLSVAWNAKKIFAKLRLSFINAAKQVVTTGLFLSRSWKQTLSWLLYLFSVQNITINSAFLTKIVVVLFVETVTPLIIAGTSV